MNTDLKELLFHRALYCSLKIESWHEKAEDAELEGNRLMYLDLRDKASTEYLAYLNLIREAGMYAEYKKWSEGVREEI